MHRGDVDHAPVVSLGQARQGVSHRMERCRQVDRDDVVPYLDADVRKGCRVLDASIVDQDVQMTPREDLSHQCVDLTHVAQIAAEETSIGTTRRPQFRDQPQSLIRAGQSMRRDSGAFFGESARDAFADTALGTSNQHRSTFELCRHGSMPSRNVSTADAAAGSSSIGA